MSEENSTRLFELDQCVLSHILDAYHEIAALNTRYEIHQEYLDALQAFQSELLTAVERHSNVQARDLLAVAMSIDVQRIELEMDEDIVLHYLIACKRLHCQSSHPTDPLKAMIEISKAWFPEEARKYGSRE